MTKESRVLIANISIDNVTMAEAVDRIDRFVGERVFRQVVTPNVDHIVRLQGDELFLTLYRQAALVLADGMPLLWSAEFLGTPLTEKVSGSDLFDKLCERAAAKGHKVFLLGGSPGSAKKTAEVIGRKYKNIQVAGFYCPALGFEKNNEENRRVIEAVRSARPDILLVGLGTPKQEKWIYQHREELGPVVAIGIGATFEFSAGVVKRAPLWMQRAGFEWFWRLCREPGRLWRRYLLDDPIFFWLIFRQKFIRR